jgi:lactoylglutathione lyase
MHLYETHLPVPDPEVAQKFYVEIVGLKFAHRDLTRDIVFLWAGDDRRSMLGLWGSTTIYGRDFHKCHVAFHVSMTELLAVGKRLNSANIRTQNFAGEDTTEPSVIGWMPSAQLYFTDPNGHSLEFITLLDEASEPDFVGSLSQWKQRQGASDSHLIVKQP